HERAARYIPHPGDGTSSWRARPRRAARAGRDCGHAADPRRPGADRWPAPPLARARAIARRARRGAGSSGGRRQYVEGDAQVKARAAGDHGEMPKRVAERKPRCAIEQKAARVGEPARRKERERNGTDRLIKGPAPAQHEPAHDEVERNGDAVKASTSRQTKDRPRDREAPHRREKEPALVAPECNKDDRRIGAGDQKEYRAVVDGAENTFQTLMPDTVIEGRREERHNEGDAVDEDTQKRQRARPRPGASDEKSQAGDACHCRTALDCRTRDLLRKRARTGAPIRRLLQLLPGHDPIAH